MGESAQKFSVRHYGRAFTSLIKIIRAVPPEPVLTQFPDDASPGLDIGEIDEARFPLWIELGAYPDGYPAAAIEIGDTGTINWNIPDDVWRNLAPALYILRLVDANGREVRNKVVHNKQ